MIQLRDISYSFDLPTPVNKATGKVVDVIPLPHFDDNTVILGFLED